MGATDDALTGLLGRRSFTALLRQHVAMANERQAQLGLLVVDISGFSRINSAHGFDLGDRVLVHVAERLRQVARPQDYAARIGDNRFALILTRVMNKGHVDLAVQKLLRVLQAPFEHGAARFNVPVTIGAAVCPQHASHADHLLRRAEAAVRAARALGADCMFAEEHDADIGIPEFWDLELELQGAVERGEMRMNYQPKVRARDRAVLGAEALMRWNHRSRGMVPPDQFIPVAERTGQIRQMTAWALNTALRHAGEWRAESRSVAVNIPAEMIARHDLPEVVENALMLWGRSGVGLVLEITERSLVADHRHSFAILSRIRDLGVRISIDDFGTGYSCLAYFRDIPADELKVDRSFVKGLLDDSACADITNLIIDLAHRFGLTVVAEGVEDEATCQALEEMGCDALQGYHFAAAMHSDEFARWRLAAAGTGLTGAGPRVQEARGSPGSAILAPGARSSAG